MRDATASTESRDFLVAAGGVSPGVHANQGIHPVRPGVVSAVAATQEAQEIEHALSFQGTIHSLAVTPGSATVSKDATQQLAATATLNDTTSTQVVTGEAAWSSATETVATVDASGLVTVLLASGSSVITAEFKGETATATITAKAAE